MFYLALHDHEFEGAIPASVGNMTKLGSFYRSNNRLEGSVPEFTHCNELTGVYLRDNNLSGELPSFSSNPNLQRFELNNNNLEGSLPGFKNNYNLATLNLNNNNLEGTIPKYSNPNLLKLDLSFNNLEGKVPPFDSCPNLIELDLNNNNLSDPLPSFNSNPDLQILDISNNHLSGPLPNFSATPHLQLLFAYNNDFFGTLSPNLFDLKNITTVILSGNANLKGALPSTLSNPSLTSLVIEGCSFTGPLPTAITSPLHSFYLAGNSFSSSIPLLPPTIIDVSLAYNQITGSIPPSFFSNTPQLKSFDVWHNKIGGSIPTSISTVIDLADLKLDLNDFSGAIPSSISTWPIFSSPKTATTVLFGNLWSCPVPDFVREHSSEDPNHAYSCGGSEFVTPAILAAAAGALFVVAASFTKQCESVLSLIGTYTRGRHEILSDASNIVNVGHACYKLVPTFLKLSVSLKTASNWLVLPLLAITTLLLLYFVNWGWKLRFEGHDSINVNAEETAKEKKKRRSWRGSLKLFGIFAYTIILVVAFDFVYVFFVATNPTISPSSKVLANTALSQFKSTLLNERWAAKASMKLINPKKRFNYLVFTMSFVMLLNALVVPSILILLLDERCFKYLLVQQEPHEADVPITYCAYLDTVGDENCPTPLYPINGYKTAHYLTTFNYPWSLSDQCGSAVIQAYSPVVILELLSSGFLQPALWWLCIDGGKSHVVKWAVLVIGLFLSQGLPQIVSQFAEDIDSGGVLGVVLGGVFAFVFLASWGATTLRKEGGGETAVKSETTWFYIPNVVYLLEFFDYNVDEDRVFGQKNYSWPLKESIKDRAKKAVGALLTTLGFAKGNFDGGLKSIIDDFRLTEETFDEEKIEKIEENKTDATKPQPPEYGEDLPYTYVNLVKNIALVFTFGLASSATAWIGCLGILFRWLALSFLAERYEKKMEERGEDESETDAQGIPFRCIVLVVFCYVGFFSTAALLAGVTVGEDEDGGGVWTPLFLSVMIIALVCQIIMLQVRTTTTAQEGNKRVDEDNQVEAVASPVHEGDVGDAGLVEIELTETPAKLKTAEKVAKTPPKEDEEAAPIPE